MTNEENIEMKIIDYGQSLSVKLEAGIEETISYSEYLIYKISTKTNLMGRREFQKAVKYEYTGKGGDAKQQDNNKIY